MLSDQISDDYSIKFSKVIGSGQFGKVYAATRKADNVIGAVKIIDRTQLNVETVRSIRKEVDALQVLSHPNIVKLYGMYEEPRHFFIVMEMVSGGELFDRICEKVFYGENDAKAICTSILSAIKHCHDNGFVHRDLKPENLLLASRDNDSDVRVVDFGFADRCPTDDSLTGIFGTPSYMAPEVWDGDRYGKPIDMWSFGVIVYILLCGYTPFNHQDRRVLMQLITQGRFAFHTEYWSIVSDGAKDFVSKLLVVDPLRRMTVDDALAHPWVRHISFSHILSRILSNHFVPIFVSFPPPC